MINNTTRRPQTLSQSCDETARTVYGWLLLFLILMSWSLPIIAADAQSYFEQGQQALRVGQTGIAERQYLRAVYEDDQHLTSYLALADLYQAQRRHSDVLEVIDKAMAIYPDNAELWARRGLVFHRSGQAGAARQAYEKAVTLAPDDPDILQQAAGFNFEMGNRAKAEELSQARRASAAKKPIVSKGNRNKP